MGAWGGVDEDGLDPELLAGFAEVVELLAELLEVALDDSHGVEAVVGEGDGLRLGELVGVEDGEGWRDGVLADGHGEECAGVAPVVVSGDGLRAVDVSEGEVVEGGEGGDVDGVVGGAVFSSADVSRAAFQVVKAAPGISSVSSCFVMVPPEDFKYKKYPAYIFSDCAVIPYPTSDQLSDIVVAAADSAKKICEMEPKIAMLSFSTKGSAKHEAIDKVREAYEKVRAEHPEIKVDGELQLDASLVDSVAAQKAPGSEVAGQANVLVFPNLDAGNIGYKLAQRFGNCMAIGPIMQGLALPVNDLSRGCVAEDIAAVAAITALQSVKG